MAAKILISVVIPAYKRPDCVRRAVESLLHQDLPADQYEVIVVDSSPDTRNREIVEELSRDAKCRVRFFHKDPEGPGPSRNLGAREASGGVIAFMDSDCMATPAWLREGLAAFEEGVGLVQGRTIPPAGVPVGIFSHYIRVEEESYLYEGANILYRREAFEGSGGFPSDLAPNSVGPVGGEDVHVAWTVKRNRWKSRFAANAVVVHDVVPIPKWKWVLNPRLFVFPLVVKKFPEIRQFLYARYFLDRNHVLLVLALAGLAAAWSNALTLALALPYFVVRASEPSKSLRGVLRPVRAVVYGIRDTAALVFLLAGSIRYRSLML